MLKWYYFEYTELRYIIETNFTCYFYLFKVAARNLEWHMHMHYISVAHATRAASPSHRPVEGSHQNTVG